MLLGSDYESIAEHTVALSSSELKGLDLFCYLFGAVGQQLDAPAVDEAIRSGDFLEWNSNLNAYAMTPVQKALARFRQELRHLRRQESGLSLSTSLGYQLQRMRDAEKYVSRPVSKDSLLTVCGVHDRHRNLLDLAAAISAAFDGDLGPLEALRLFSFYPLQVEPEGINSKSGERVMTALDLRARADEIVAAAKTPAARSKAPKPTDES